MSFIKTEETNNGAKGGKSRKQRIVGRWIQSVRNQKTKGVLLHARRTYCVNSTPTVAH